MNTIKDILKDSVIPERLFFGSPFRNNYLWKNLVIEKQTSMGQSHKYYARNILLDIWSLFSSPVV
jgi:hypothetical protein